MNEEDNQQEDIDKLKADLEATTNNWKRTAADFDNYRRRKEAEGSELIAFAREVTVAKLLPALDTLEQALKHMPEGNEEFKIQNSEFSDKYHNWQKGIKGLVAQLDKTLEDLGVKKIEAVGKKFDPHYHEAVREAEGDEDGVVLEELQTGFELNGKVIRPSQVVISKKS